MPIEIEIEGVGPVEFPDSMTDAEVNDAAAKLYDLANPKAWKPPTPEEMVAHPGPYRQRQAPTDQTKVGDTARLLGSGATFGALPSAAAALAASVPALDRRAAWGDTWDERFANARQEYGGLREASRESMGAAAMPLEIGGSLASGAVLGRALAPLTTLVGSGVSPLLPHAPTWAAPAMQTIAGIGDAALGSGLLSGLAQTGTPEGFARAAQEGFSSPYNVLGGLPATLGPAVSAAGDAAGRRAARKAYEAIDPQRNAIKALREHYGVSSEAVDEATGSSMLDMQMPDGTPLMQRGDTASNLAGKMKAARENVGGYGPRKGQAIEDIDLAGGRADPEPLFADFRDIIRRNLYGPGEQVLSQQDPARAQALDLYKRLRRALKRKAIGQEFSYPMRQEPLPMGLGDSTSPAVPVGGERAPDTVSLLRAKTRDGRDIPDSAIITRTGGSAETTGTGVPGRPIPESELLPQDKQIKIPIFDGDLAPGAGSTGASPAQMAAAEEGGLPPPEPVASYTRSAPGQFPPRYDGEGQVDRFGQPIEPTTRPLPDNGWGVLTETTRGPVTSNEIGYQLDLPMSLNPRRPLPGKTIFENPKLSLTEDIKSALGRQTRQTASTLPRPEGAIDNDPNLSVMDQLRSRLMREGEAVAGDVDEALLAELRSNKQAFGDTKLLEGIAQTEADAVLKRARQAKESKNKNWAGRTLGYRVLPGAVSGLVGGASTGNPWAAGAAVAGGVFLPELASLFHSSPVNASLRAKAVENLLRRVEQHGLKLDPSTVNSLIVGGNAR